MDSEKRKREISRRLLIARYPRRAAAKFTYEDDHNPLVLQDCSHCHGTGDICIHGNGVHELILCKECGGEGITGEIELYFRNNGPPVEVSPNDAGWVKCPSCGWRFLFSDAYAWTGYRHRKCGQRIVISSS